MRVQRAIAVTGAQRMPEVPTVAESGLTEFEYHVAATDGGKNLATPGGDAGLHDRPTLPFHDIGLLDTQEARGSPALLNVNFDNSHQSLPAFWVRCGKVIGSAPLRKL